MEQHTLQTSGWRKWIFPARPDLPADLTTYDWLKTVAILLMIIDHIGYYIFPQIEWFRVFGRLCVPIFFFLIGYANTRELNTRWLAGVFILMASSLIIGMSPLPLSILMTMLLVRASLNPLMTWLEGHMHYFWWVVLLLIFGMYPTNLFLEYGTMGMLLAMCGFCVRHKELVEEHLGEYIPSTLMMVSYSAFGIISALYFGFTFMAWMVLAAGLVGLYFVLHAFKGEVIPNSASHPHAALIRFTGRYTLEIYIIHILLLKLYLVLSMAAQHIIATGA